MRSHNVPERGLLPLRELREHKWVFVSSVKNSEMAVGERITCDWYPHKMRLGLIMGRVTSAYDNEIMLTNRM